MFGKLGALFGAFVYGGSYHLRGGGGGGCGCLMAPYFFSHSSLCTAKRQQSNVRNMSCRLHRSQQQMPRHASCSDIDQESLGVL